LQSFQRLIVLEVASVAANPELTEEEFLVRAEAVRRQIAAERPDADECLLWFSYVLWPENAWPRLTEDPLASFRESGWQLRVSGVEGSKSGVTVAARRGDVRLRVRAKTLAQAGVKLERELQDT
jgi:hypothetical protein